MKNFIFKCLPNDCKNYILQFLENDIRMKLKYNIPTIKYIQYYKIFIKEIKNIHFNKKLDILLKFPFFDRMLYKKLGHIYLEEICQTYWINPEHNIPIKKFSLKIVFNDYLHFKNLSKNKLKFNLNHNYYYSINYNNILYSLLYSNKKQLQLMCKINNIKKISTLNKNQLIKKLIEL